ncbi:carbonic anhydrase [Pseudomonas abietaniphila]|jgi:carbonic anhydrase|uniref:carbonic anhydrase n=1 Tax=Pseudomonas abietaniphila TaxID=89065 RepID=UPI0032170922
MSVIDDLMQRNEAFATEGFNAELKMMPSMKTVVIGCVDPRVDPAEVLGLKHGEAAIIRNVGGRINPPALQNMAIVRSLAAAQGKDIGPGWNLIVLHHTDCGIGPCRHLVPDLLAKNLGVETKDLDSLAIADPYEAVAIDVAKLKANPSLPGGFTVTGLVYDVATGRVNVVVPPAQLRPDA